MNEFALMVRRRAPFWLRSPIGIKARAVSNHEGDEMRGRPILGLGLCLWHRNSPSRAYRLAANYCEHYDPRYGNGLNGPSIKRIQEIADFVLAVETYENGEASA